MVRYIILSILIVTTGICLKAQTSSIRVSGRWSAAPSVAELITESGNDFNSTYESSISQSALIITKADGLSWRIDVKKIDGLWDNSLSLSIRRTSNGIPQIPPSTLGTIYFPLTSIDQIFFTGSGNCDDIFVQYKIDGISALLPADTYDTEVVFTITDL